MCNDDRSCSERRERERESCSVAQHKGGPYAAAAAQAAAGSPAQQPPGSASTQQPAITPAGWLACLLVSPCSVRVTSRRAIGSAEMKVCVSACSGGGAYALRAADALLPPNRKDDRLKGAADASYSSITATSGLRGEVSNGMQRREQSMGFAIQFGSDAFHSPICASSGLRGGTQTKKGQRTDEPWHVYRHHGPAARD